MKSFAHAKRSLRQRMANSDFEPITSDAARRTNVSYSVSLASRLTNTKISITAMNRNTVPTIHAMDVE